MEMYGYIYLTENLINGKCYIGRHKSKKFDINYKGSGPTFKRALEKYGWDNFVTTVIDWCYSEEEAYNKEEYWINKCNAVESKYFYNQHPGGKLSGGYVVGYFDKERIEKVNNKISNSVKALFASDKGDEVKAKIRYTLWDSLTADEKTEYAKKSGENAKRGWANMSDEKRQKFKEKCKLRTGGKNSCARKVMCVETGDVFDCIKAAKQAGYRGNIGKVCMHKLESCCGYHWEYVDNKGIKDRKKRK